MRTDSPGSAINFELKSALKIAICSCPKEQSVEGRLSSFHLKKYRGYHHFPQARWTARVNETDSNYVILVNIQRRIKSRIWSAQPYYPNFFNLQEHQLIQLSCVKIQKCSLNLKVRRQVEVKTWIKIGEPPLFQS